MNIDQLKDLVKKELRRVKFEGEHSVDLDIESYEPLQYSRGFWHNKYYADPPSPYYDGAPFLTKEAVIKKAKEQFDSSILNKVDFRVYDNGQGQFFILIVTIRE